MNERLARFHLLCKQISAIKSAAKPLNDFDLRSLLEALSVDGVRFVVIGGVAVGAHGYVRATEDLDLVPDPDPENLSRLTEALTNLERRFRRRRNDPSMRPWMPERSGAEETCRR